MVQFQLKKKKKVVHISCCKTSCVAAWWFAYVAGGIIVLFMLTFYMSLKGLREGDGGSLLCLLQVKWLVNNNSFWCEHFSQILFGSFKRPSVSRMFLLNRICKWVYSRIDKELDKSFPLWEGCFMPISLKPLS